MSLIIGLTGASGSGKSTAAKELEKKGYLIIDLDSVTHSVYTDCEDCKNELKEIFGNCVIKDGAVNRRYLAKIVFSDREKLSILNKTVHKYILERLHNFLDGNKGKNIVIDAPLLFEAELDKICDVTVCVVCSFDKKIERIKKRDSISYDEAVMRLKNQKDDNYYIEKCDLAIENDDKIDMEKFEDFIKNKVLGGAK